MREGLLLTIGEAFLQRNSEGPYKEKHLLRGLKGGRKKEIPNAGAREK